MFEDGLEKGACVSPMGSWGAGTFQAQGTDSAKASSSPDNKAGKTPPSVRTQQLWLELVSAKLIPGSPARASQMRPGK